MNWQRRLADPDDAPDLFQVALSDAAVMTQRGSVAMHVWQQEMDPGFPLAVLEYEVRGADDPLHWHDHLEIAQVLDGDGDFVFGRRVLPGRPGDVFFIDNSRPHVARARSGETLRLLLVLVRVELIAGPGCRELDLGYLEAFRGGRTRSPRIDGATALAGELDAAIHELLSTDLSVAEVAGAVSYTNLQQFYKVFYRSCAMSPAEYRRYYTPAGRAVSPAPTR